MIIRDAPNGMWYQGNMKYIAAAIILSIFGLVLIWQGLTGNVVKTIDQKAFFPRWVYILGGVGLLILPIIYFIALAQIRMQ